LSSPKQKKSIYHRISLGYEVGLGKIYTKEEIERAKESPSFEREYNLKYWGGIGNVFTEQQIQKAIELGEKYKDLEVNQYAQHFGGIDPESKAAVYIGELDTENEIIRIIEGVEYPRTITPSELADNIFNFHLKYHNLRWFIDGNHRGYVNEIKKAFREPEDWMKAEDVNAEDYKVLPVNFRTEHKLLLFHTWNLLSKEMIAIPKKYNQLITSMRSAWAVDFDLDKDETVNNDHLDSFRLMLKGVKISETGQ